ncbi:M14 family metallopeptidase [Congregibacter litoralis]|uniref:Putative deacylase n=1 Tax=Congregibacter litoralis KT71 TaxID=314285 RepID=A4A4Y7_9GAMM|nr:M14 family metallocarboxypeptidase [Congregibacter litoralis]EAQ98858.1 putative deacylase [Congregibacter litoralis KT71]
MSDSDSYAIGDSRVPWGIAEKAAWRAVQEKQRSYSELVELRVQALMEHYDVAQYGSLSYDSDEYALHALSSKNWNPELPNILVTGGVHGYETSGVMGALSFLETACEAYQGAFNFLVMPCVSPWAFETINRWNPLAIDPNRSFVANSPAEESAAVMDWLSRRGWDFLGHFDLHETTDTDNSEFRPALAARDAKPQDHWDIPDGFYGVADSSRPSPEFQRAIIESVARVTHIAPSIDGRIIGETLQQEGVICYDGKGLGLCMGVTDAPFVTTTEVYPDSPLVTDNDCIAAQVAAVTGGLEYLLSV